MKVLLISHMPPPTTGIGSWTRRVLQNGIPNCEICFVNSNMIGGRDPFQNTKMNLKDEIIRSFGIWKNEYRELKQGGYAVVHTNIPCTLMGLLRELVTAVIAKRFGCKFFIHCHCTVPNVVNSALKKMVFHIVDVFTDGYIVLNTQSKDFVSKYSKKKTEIIPNFVCMDELPECGERGIKETVKDVLFVGGVSPDKGCDTVIYAAQKTPEITYHLVGIVSQEISEMEIPENVKLYGNKDKDFVHQIMRKCDVFVFLSRYFGEGFSVALVEAMANGLPCIVTDWAANADMIGREGEGGFVIQQQDPDGLCRAISNMQSPKIRADMSERNIKTVSEYYTDKTVLLQIEDFYRLGN